MNFKTLSVSALTLALLASSCGPKITQEEHDNFILLHQKGGKSISYCPESGVQLLYDKGYAFKDLNKNGKLDIYEDWRMAPEDRAADLASQISIEHIAGLMLYSSHTRIPQQSKSKPMSFTYGGKPFAQSEADSADICDQLRKAIIEDNLRHVLFTQIASPGLAATIFRLLLKAFHSVFQQTTALTLATRPELQMSITPDVMANHHAGLLHLDLEHRLIRK